MRTLGRARRPKTALAVVVAALLATGCAKGSSDARPSLATTTPTAVPQTSSEADGNALAAYRAMMGDLVVVSRSPDPNDRRLKAHASSDALALLRYMMNEDRTKKVVAKGQMRLDPAVLTNDGSRAVIRDCADDATWLLYTRDGKLMNDVPGGRHHVDATVRKHDAGWMVERLHFDQVGSC